MFNSVWFKSWRVNRQLCWYLNLISSYVYNSTPLSWQVWAIFAFQIIYVLQSVFLSFPSCELDEYSRFLIGDNTLFYLIPQRVNLLIAALSLQSLHSLYVLFGENFTARNCSKFLPLKLINEILYGNKGDEFFFDKYTQVKGKVNRIKVSTVVKKQMFYYQLTLLYFWLTAGIFFKYFKD